MTLQFVCPAGHSISCPDKLAGKPAKCPQCSVKFIVPPPGQKQAEPISGSRSDAGSAKQRAEQIAFLCPNGHRLNGPKRLEGKPGQCPECGAKFRIPSYDEPEFDDQDADDDEILTGEVVGDDEIFDAVDMEEIEIVEHVEVLPPEDDFSAGFPFSPEPERFDFSADPAHVDEPEEIVEDFAHAAPTYVEGSHALCGIFSLLWQQRQYGGGVEMQLAEGELLAPDYFSPEMSLGTHGLFAVRGKDNLFTIISVPWDAVRRVSLRKTDHLPPGLFEE
ncbi:MAG: hypothetical protein KDA41_14635 [Planctomycetales bacterium]|nr:hypothetical protein [Planctomycetales bacterium]